jgi:hypothetical protein
MSFKFVFRDFYFNIEQLLTFWNSIPRVHEVLEASIVDEFYTKYSFNDGIVENCEPPYANNLLY